MKNSIYNIDEPNPSEAEISGARQDTAEYLHIWKKRALYTTAAFFLSCAVVSLFLKGSPLHVYWESLGRYLLLLSMALLLPFVACVGIAINSWFFLRALKRGKL
jgi:hypothetical protein